MKLDFSVMTFQQYFFLLLDTRQTDNLVVKWAGSVSVFVKSPGVWYNSLMKPWFTTVLYRREEAKSNCTTERIPDCICHRG